MRILKSGILLCCFLLFSCETIVDCLLKIEPYIEDKNLNNGVFMQPYEDFVVVGVENADDSLYIIDKATIDGDLPPGVTSSYNGRKVTFSGTPSVSGTYEFKVTVVLVDTDSETNNDNLCGNTTSKSFQITIY